MDESLEEKDEDVTVDHPDLLKKGHLFKKYTPFTVS
jgi:hypothetical protein